MAESISWLFSIDVAGGPTVAGKGVVALDAYDKLSVEVPAKAGNAAGSADVEVHPAAAAGAVSLLAVTAATYAPGVTYKIGTGNAAKTFALDGPLLLVGSGAVGLLGSPTPVKVAFENDTADPVIIGILVGRDATA